MCFKPKNNITEPMTYSEDITVYKVFRKVMVFGTPCYYTGAFQNDFIYNDLNGVYFNDDFLKQYKNHFLGFHSFKEYNDAVWLMDSLERWGDYNKETFEVIPCIIPAGTPFLEGYYYTKESYLSKVIKLDY